MRRHLNSKLARWGFPALGILAADTGQLLPALFCAVLSLIAWKDHR